MAFKWIQLTENTKKTNDQKMCLSKEHQRKIKTLNNFTPGLLSAIFLSLLFKDYRRSWTGKEHGSAYKSLEVKGGEGEAVGGESSEMSGEKKTEAEGSG